MELRKIKSIILYGNIKINIALIKNIESRCHIKHIDMQHHYIHKLVEEKKLTIK